MFDMFDNAISNELGVTEEIYDDVIENKCTYWEGYFIILAMLSFKLDKIKKAKKLFKECQKR